MTGHPLREQTLRQVQAALAAAPFCDAAAMFELEGTPPRPRLFACFGPRGVSLSAAAENVVRAATAGDLFVLFPRCEGADESTVCLPLRTEGRLVGALVLFGRPDGGEPRAGSDAAALAALSSRVTAALLAASHP